MRRVVPPSDGRPTAGLEDACTLSDLNVNAADGILGRRAVA